MADIKIDPAAGAPAKKLDEATATFLAALALIDNRPGTSPTAKAASFNSALRHPGVSKDTTTNKVVHSPSPAQLIVHSAQKAGLVEGDVFKRLGVKEA